MPKNAGFCTVFLYKTNKIGYSFYSLTYNLNKKICKCVRMNVVDPHQPISGMCKKL